MTLQNASLPPPERQLPDTKGLSRNSTSELAKGINKEQVIELFEWEGKSSKVAIEFYKKHQHQLISGALTLPDIVAMIQSLPEAGSKAEEEKSREEIIAVSGDQERKQLPKSSHTALKNYSYKKRLYLDVEAVIKQGLNLNLDEYIILIWAYDFAKGGNCKSRKENNQEYFWFKAEKCLADLPLIGVNTNRGVRAKFKSLTRKGLLIPHPNRKGIGAYYGFTNTSKQIFKNHRVLAVPDLIKYLIRFIKSGLIDSSEKDKFIRLIREALQDGKINPSEKDKFIRLIREALQDSKTNPSEKDKFIRLIQKALQDGKINPSEKDKFIRLIQEALQDGKIDPSEKDNFVQVTRINLSYNNMVNDNIVSHNNQTLSKENFEFFEKLKIQNQTLVKEKEREKEIFERKIQELEKENKKLKEQIQDLEAKTEVPSSSVSKQMVFEIFKNTGCADRAEIFYTENKELIKSGYMSKATIERKAKEMMVMIQKAPSKKTLPREKPKTESSIPDAVINNKSQIHQLALQTFEVFGISPSKTDLDTLIQNIKRIKKERNIPLTTMQSNLQMYEAFVNTQGVTTNYSLKNWLSGDGNGYGKNWEKWLEKAQKNLQVSPSKKVTDKALSSSLDYSNYKTSKRPSFYPEKKSSTKSNI